MLIITKFCLWVGNGMNYWLIIEGLFWPASHTAKDEIDNKGLTRWKKRNLVSKNLTLSKDQDIT